MGKVCMTRELIRLILILNVGITCIFCEDVTPTASTVNHATLSSVSTTLDDSSVGHDVSESIKKTTVQEVETSQFLDNDQSSQILVPAETTTAVLPSSSMVTGYGESSSSLAPDLTSSILEGQDGLVSSSSDNKYLSTSMSETVDAASVSLTVSTTEMLHTSDLLPDSVMGTSMQSSLSETLQSHSTSTISSITDLSTSLTEIDSVMSSFTDIVSSLPSSMSSVVSSVSGGLSSIDGQTVTEIVSNSEHTSTVVLSAASSSSIVVSESSSVTSSSDLVIAPTSTAMIPESSSTLPENAGPQHNKGGLSSGEKAALGICIPIVIVICLAGLIYYLYRRRYHVASWKLSDVVSYRPWSYRNASYYDDESSLIIPSLK